MKRHVYSFDADCGVNILEKTAIDNNEFFLRGNAKNVKVGDVISCHLWVLKCIRVKVRDSRGQFTPPEKAINNYFEGVFSPYIQ